MTPGTVVALLVGIALIAALAGVGILTAALLWSVFRLRPHYELESDVSGVKAMVDNLEAQVIQLRTQKANRRSQERRATATVQQEEEDSPLAGLTPEEKALFQGLEN